MYLIFCSFFVSIIAYWFIISLKIFIWHFLLISLFLWHCQNFYVCFFYFLRLLSAVCINFHFASRLKKIASWLTSLYLCYLLLSVNTSNLSLLISLSHYLNLSLSIYHYWDFRFIILSFTDIYPEPGLYHNLSFPPIHLSFSPVGWGCRICWLHLYRRVRSPALLTSVQDMTPNCIWWWSSGPRAFGEC